MASLSFSHAVSLFENGASFEPAHLSMVLPGPPLLLSDPVTGAERQTFLSVIPEVLFLVEQIRPTTTQIDNLWTPISVLL